MSSQAEITQIVEEVYLEILERPADRTGLDHWVQRMMESNDPLNTKEELIALFKLSSEYKNLQLNETIDCSEINDKLLELSNKLDMLISLYDISEPEPEPEP